MKTTSVLHVFTPLLESGARLQVAPAGEGGRTFKGVTIIKAGLGNRKDRNYYPPDTLKAAVGAGMFEGLRAYADHPTSVDEEIQPERTIRDMVGLYSGTRFVKEKQGGRVIGDLRVFRSHKWLADTVAELVEIGHGDKIGISINGRGQTEPHRLTMQESGESEELDVNRVVRFVDLRSADVVTEAGAGGGFQQLLESAKSAHDAEGSMTMDRKEIVKALTEAAEAGDLDKVKALTAQLTKLEEAEGADETTEEAAADPDAEGAEGADADGDEADPDAELDEAVEEASKAKADVEPDPADDGECDEKDSLEECNDKRKKKMEEKATTKAGKKAPCGKKFGEALTPDEAHELRVANAQLNERVTKLEKRNERLAEALKQREKGDIIRKLLKESRIPSEDRAVMVPRLMKCADETEMKGELEFQSRLVESVVRRVREDFAAGAGDGYSEVEGAGATVRESSHGARSVDVDETSAILTESGLPLKK